MLTVGHSSIGGKWKKIFRALQTEPRLYFHQRLFVNVCSMLMKHFYARTIFFLSQFPFGVSRSWLSLEVLREDGNEWFLNKVGWKVVLDRKAFWSCEASLIEIQVRFKVGGRFFFFFADWRLNLDLETVVKVISILTMLSSAITFLDARRISRNRRLCNHLKFWGLSRLTSPAPGR